jgi:hypothetical protein
MDPLTIALAIYGGYQGYKSSKKAGANTLGRIFGTALGAYGGYNLGTGIGSLTNAGTAAAQNLGQTAVAEGVTQGIGAFNPYAAATDQFAGTTLSNAMDPALTNALGTYNDLAPKGIAAYNPQFQQLEPSITNAAYNVPYNVPDNKVLTYSDIPGEQSFSYTEPVVQQVDYKGAVPSMDDVNRRQAISDKLIADQQRAQAELYRYDPSKTQSQLAKSAAERGVMPAGDYSQLETFGQRVDPTKTPKSFTDTALEMAKKTFYDENKGVKLGNVAAVGLPALTYFSGAFEREPFQRNQFTYNVNYPDLYRGRKFYTQDPKTGEIKELEQQAYIPEEKAKESITSPEQQFGPYKRETITLQQGGLATLNHFRDGGVNYLPSKTIHDEDDEDNYMRTNGYVEDGAGNGDKEEDTMLAQLADGEFVTRTDGVLGAGILAGANPKNAKEMRKLGAEFFYEQQKRFKRIYDLLDASRKATAH